MPHVCPTTDAKLGNYVGIFPHMARCYASSRLAGIRIYILYNSLYAKTLSMTISAKIGILSENTVVKIRKRGNKNPSEIFCFEAKSSFPVSAFLHFITHCISLKYA